MIDRFSEMAQTNHSIQYTHASPMRLMGDTMSVAAKLQVIASP